MTALDFFNDHNEAISTKLAPKLRTFTALAKWPITRLTASAKEITFTSYEHRKPFRLHVRADHRALGCATIADEGVLICAATHLAARLDAQQALNEPLFLHPNAMLRLLGQATGGAQRRGLRAAFDRLHNTAVTTDLAPGGERRSTFFNIIEQFEAPASGQHGPWRIHLASWFIEQVARRQILALDLRVLALRGLERRVANWARAHAGGRGHETWRLPLRLAHAKAGSTDAPRKFVHALRQLVHRHRIPDFQLAIDRDGSDEVLIIKRLRDAPANDAVPTPGPGPGNFDLGIDWSQYPEVSDTADEPGTVRQWDD